MKGARSNRKSATAKTIQTSNKPPARPDEPDDESLTLENLYGPVVSTEYVFANLDVRERQSWLDVAAQVVSTHSLALHRAKLFQGGLIVGLDEIALSRHIHAALQQSHPGVAERVLSDQSVFAASAFEEIFHRFIDLAAVAAIDVAMQIGHRASIDPDVYMSMPSRQQSSDEPQALRLVPEPASLAVKRMIKEYSARMRELLRDIIDDPKVAKRVGRRAERSRDHAAFCLREWLLHSARSPLAHLTLHRRQVQAKKTVLRTVVAPGADSPGSSDSNWSRIVRQGREIHAALHGGATPFCDPPPRQPA